MYLHKDNESVVPQVLDVNELSVSALTNTCRETSRVERTAMLRSDPGEKDTNFRSAFIGRLYSLLRVHASALPLRVDPVPLTYLDTLVPNAPMYWVKPVFI